jgi:hypothetical protein
VNAAQVRGRYCAEVAGALWSAPELRTALQEVAGGSDPMENREIRLRTSTGERQLRLSALRFTDGQGRPRLLVSIGTQMDEMVEH